nr:guanine nucleotide exchange factor MSS4 homolog [Onthophagus taurus]
MPEQIEDFTDEIKNGKNARSVTCKFCSSIILQPATADISNFEFDLPLMSQRKDTHVIETEKVSQFWTVDNIYTFYNVGFSNTVDNKKYLICGDCEAGPVGYHDVETKKSYVALIRILHK